VSALPRRLSVLVAGLSLAAGLAACGNKLGHPTTGDNQGFYVDAGPITYQVQIFRELNPYSIEDHQYLAGVSATGPTPDEGWYAVFLWAKNQSKAAQTTSDRFDIVDTVGTRYYPIPINAQLNQYAWTAETLKPLQTEPGPDTTASFGPSQGGELLFKLNNSIYSNRPLTFEIYAPGQSSPSTISLDL
jgi:hypothetical protein